MSQSLQFIRKYNGFTLLEVLISVAIMATILTILFGAQSRSIQLADEADFNTVAPMLAQEKLAEFRAGLTDINHTSGKFDRKLPGYNWQLKIRAVDFSESPHMKAMEPFFNRAEIIVSKESRSFSLSTLIFSLDHD